MLQIKKNRQSSFREKKKEKVVTAISKIKQQKENNIEVLAARLKFFHFNIEHF